MKLLARIDVEYCICEVVNYHFLFHLYKVVKVGLKIIYLTLNVLI